jgi:hypothetical protein
VRVRSPSESDASAIRRITGAITNAESPRGERATSARVASSESTVVGATSVGSSAIASKAAR